MSMKLALGALALVAGAEGRKLQGHSDLRFTDPTEYIFEYFEHPNTDSYSDYDYDKLNYKEVAWMENALEQQHVSFYEDYHDDDEKYDYAMSHINAFDKDGDKKLDSDEFRKLKAFYYDPYEIVCTKKRNTEMYFIANYPDDDEGMSDTGMRTAFLTDQIAKTKNYDMKIKNWCHKGMDDYQEYWPVVTMATWMKDIAEFVTTDGTVDGEVTWKSFVKGMKLQGGNWNRDASDLPVFEVNNYFKTGVANMWGPLLKHQMEQECGMTETNGVTVTMKEFMTCYLAIVASEGGGQYLPRDVQMFPAAKANNIMAESSMGMSYFD